MKHHSVTRNLLRRTTRRVRVGLVSSLLGLPAARLSLIWIGTRIFRIASRTPQRIEMEHAGARDLQAFHRRGFRMAQITVRDRMTGITALDFLTCHSGYHSGYHDIDAASVWMYYYY